MIAMPMPKSQINDDAEREAKRRAIAEARADAAAGRVISHADMSKWLDSWGSPDELPQPSRLPAIALANFHSRAIPEKMAPANGWCPGFIATC
jgi:hypothetical protein